MKTEVFSLPDAFGLVLPAVLWTPEEPPRAVLQITHGMTEHMGRYTGLAQALTAQGIAVAGFDLRGHGQNSGDPRCASFGEDGWDATLEDMHHLFLLLSYRFPRLPHAMLGFSLGSFLLRDYLSRYDDPVSRAALLGTGTQPGPVLAMLKALVSNQIHRAGFDRTTPLVQKLSFETYNKKFAPNRTSADWLCADEDELDLYQADPLCRESISAGLFWQLLDSMQRTGEPHTYDPWPSALPVLLLSGQEDPVGDFGKGVRTVEAQMKKAGLTEVQLQLLPGARHDLLHEKASGNARRAVELLTDFLREA